MIANYPETPGFKERNGTSEEAAENVASKATVLRARVLRLFDSGDFTADEVAGALCESVLSVRPRVTELFKQGVLEKTKERRKNESGASAVVWRKVRKLTQGNLL